MGPRGLYRCQACVLLALATAHALAACATNRDCNMCGNCTAAGTCACDTGWTGAACEHINFGPAHRCGSGGLCLEGQHNFTSTWGGEAAQAPDGSWHMLAAGFASNKPLDAWLTASRVLHASADTPAGPYTLRDVLPLGANPSSWDGQTQHNPALLYSNPDSKYLLWYMGNTAHPANSSHCPQQLGPSACTQRIGLASASSPSGPWTEHGIVMDVGTAAHWDDLFTTNPTPHLFANGSVLLLYKARSQEDWHRMSTGAAWAEHWSGPYTRLTPNTPIDVDPKCEDAGMYYSERMSVFRSVMHCGCEYQTIWSENGVDWQRTAPMVPWCNLEYQGGGNETLLRRERPKWVMSNGLPIGMLTGVMPGASDHGGQSWTMYQTISP